MINFQYKSTIIKTESPFHAAFELFLKLSKNKTDTYYKLFSIKYGNKEFHFSGLKSKSSIEIVELNGKPNVKEISEFVKNKFASKIMHNTLFETTVASLGTNATYWTIEETSPSSHEDVFEKKLNSKNKKQNSIKSEKNINPKNCVFSYSANKMCEPSSASSEMEKLINKSFLHTEIQSSHKKSESNKNVVTHSEAVNSFDEVNVEKKIKTHIYL
jgi:hypothetical protein